MIGQPVPGSIEYAALTQQTLAEEKKKKKSA
jgi:hypothetical protein